MAKPKIAVFSGPDPTIANSPTLLTSRRAVAAWRRFDQWQQPRREQARMLLMASLLKLRSLPAAKDPRNPTTGERRAAVEKVAAYHEIFESH